MPNPTPASLFDLKLKADLTAANGLFLPLASNPGRSRVWAQEVVGSNSWQDLPTDPDTRGNGPNLQFNTNLDNPSDTFQVTVYFVNALPTDFATITISAVFTPFRHGSVVPPPLHITPAASPFRDANGNVQSIVAGTWGPTSNTGNIYLHPDTGPGEHAIVFTPGAFNIDPTVVTNGAKWRFEFTVVAQFTTAAGVTKQYAYDPEMEIEITSSGNKPIPAGKAGACGV